MAAEQAKWYVIHTYSGYEAMVKDGLEKLIENNNLQNNIFAIEIPMEETLEETTENTKPEVSIRTEGTNIVVDAKDDEGISKILVTVDGEEKDSGEDPVDQKEVSAKVQVPIGTHEIKATVTNVNGLEATKEITANI